MANRTYIRTTLANSMFLGLIASFLLIILLSSTLYFVAYRFFINNIELEIVSNASHAIDYTTDKLDERFYQIKNLLLNISLEEDFSPVVNGRQTLYSQKQIINFFSDKYKVSNEYILKYISSIFILPEDSYKNILALDSTYPSDRFFNAFYKSPVYTMDFWLQELGREFTFNFYPTGEFSDYSNYSNKNPFVRTLMPLAFKHSLKSDFMIVAFIDINALNNSIDKYAIDNFYIYDSNSELLYPSKQDVNFSNGSIDSNARYIKTENGYLFSRRSGEDNLIYTTFLSNAKLKEQLGKTNSMFRLIALVSLILSVVISVYLVKIFNNPVKQIAEIIKHSTNKYGNREVIGLKNIRDSIKMLIKDNEAQSSMLETFFYQSRLKGNYSPLSEMKKKFNFTHYALICFILHYKNKCSDELVEEVSKGTFFLKELIALYINSYFKDSITFQIENDKIISIVNVSGDMQDIAAIVNEIAGKLKYEEDYVFFTITLSRVCSDTSQLHKTYDKLFEMSRYRKLTSSTQILSEDIIKTFTNRFYLSSEQMEQFENLLVNGQQKECMEFVNDTLQYNFRKGINNFYIQLLCIEIVNCCIKSLTKLYYDVPACFDATNIYSQFNQFTTIDEYIDSCRHFIISVTDYIHNNKKESDYIIDYITGYIEKHYAEEIYLDLLAEKLGITNNYISSYFREKVGTNFNYYLNDYRIKKAVELIETTPSKVKDIAKMVGCPNVNTFTRIFKKHIGKTPEDFRRELVR